MSLFLARSFSLCILNWFPAIIFCVQLQWTRKSNHNLSKAISDLAMERAFKLWLLFLFSSIDVCSNHTQCLKLYWNGAIRNKFPPIIITNNGPMESAIYYENCMIIGLSKVIIVYRNIISVHNTTTSWVLYTFLTTFSPKQQRTLAFILMLTL